MEPYSTPQKMKSVGDLFERYKTRIKAPQSSVEKACSAAIKEITGFDVPVDCVSYTVSTRTAFLKVSSVLKTELRFHYPQIIELLQKQLGRDVAPVVIL